MTNYCGYMGKVQLLDLSTHTVKDYLWTDAAREKYIGGKAMASKILYDNLTGRETPLGEDNLIVIAAGPLTGTGAPSSNRFDISSLSPLTGITASSNCGERSYNLERALNARFGVSAKNDTLPKRLTDTPQNPNKPNTKVPLETMKRAYYHACGWGQDGLPGKKKLKRLGIACHGEG